MLGLHSVFEHHDAMGPVSLEAFLHENRIGFPVGVGAHDQPGGTPITMARYRLLGTPSLILIDRAGRIRLGVERRRPKRPGPMALVACLRICHSATWRLEEDRGP